MSKDRSAYYRAYRELHREEILQRERAHYKKHKARLYARKKIHRQEIKDEINAKYREYYIRNRDRIRARVNARTKERRKNDINFRLRVNLRLRINQAIKRRVGKQHKKSRSAVKDLGCSVDELIAHIEANFKDGMSWDNYGARGWHIDHIIPLAHFDLTDDDQMRKAIHFSNLQPLWAVDNIRKGAKLMID